MYKLTNRNVVIREIDGAQIPTVEDNTDYQDFLKWAQENTPIPADPIDFKTPVLNAFAQQRETYLNRLAGLAVFETDASTKTAAASFRQALLDLPQNPAIAAATTEAELKTAIVTLYRAAKDAAVAAAPNGKAAFDKVGR